jgi:hypothetical protein
VDAGTWHARASYPTRELIQRLLYHFML